MTTNSNLSGCLFNYFLILGFAAAFLKPLGPCLRTFSSIFGRQNHAEFACKFWIGKRAPVSTRRASFGAIFCLFFGTFGTQNPLKIASNFEGGSGSDFWSPRGLLGAVLGSCLHNFWCKNPLKIASNFGGSSGSDCLSPRGPSKAKKYGFAWVKLMFVKISLCAPGCRQARFWSPKWSQNGAQNLSKNR